MGLRRLLGALVCTLPVLACTCESDEPVKACQLYQDTPVIFRGRVFDDNADRKSGHSHVTLYRFQVLEAFKGLAAETKEVFIDPASSTSCYRNFESGRDYLVYAGGNHPAMTLSDSLGDWRAIPTAWQGLGRLPVFIIGTCDPTRILRDRDADLDYLRSAPKIHRTTNGWIEGRAVQNFHWPKRFADFVAATDTILTVVSSSGDRKSDGVRADGTFKIGPVRPGTYEISAHSASLGVGQFRLPDQKIRVPAGGCAVANTSFETGSRISGKVLGPEGKPAPNISVGLGELQEGGSKVRGVPYSWADTDTDGNFEIVNAPVGRTILAANLNGAPTERMPFETVYAPGTQNISGARVFSLRRGEQMTGILFRLPEALPFGDLYVEVKWPDGSPATDGARAFASWNGAEADFERAPQKTNRVKLRLALGRKYELRADWANSAPDRFRYVEGTSPRTIEFTRSGQSVELRLDSPRPR